MDEDVDEETLRRHQKDVEERYRRRSAATLNEDILNDRRHESMPSILDRLQQKYASNQQYDDVSVAPSDYGTSNIATHAQSVHHSNMSSAPQISSRMYHQSSVNIEATLPNVQDPNLWLVPCLPGKERYAV